MIRPVILCKAPLPGAVKTRLSPPLAPEAAALAHAAMADIVIRRCLALFPQTWIATDDPHHPFFAAYGCPVVAQGAGDLGARLVRLMQRAFSQGADGVLFLGSDSPHMATARLHYAMRYLGRWDVVIGPVEDGGYDLIATRRCEPRLFTGIPWGESGVLVATLMRVREAALSYRLLSKQFDVDSIGDLLRAARAGFRLPLPLQRVLSQLPPEFESMQCAGVPPHAAYV